MLATSFKTRKACMVLNSLTLYEITFKQNNKVKRSW